MRKKQREAAGLWLISHGTGELKKSALLSLKQKENYIYVYLYKYIKTGIWALP